MNILFGNNRYNIKSFNIYFVEYSENFADVTILFQ